jgi:hypothetical protein
MPTIDEELIKDLMFRATADVHAPVSTCTRVIRERRHSRRTRRAIVTTTATALTAAAAAITVATVASAPTVPHGRATATVTGPATTKTSATTKAPAASKHVASPLVRLADYVSASATPPGNATLIARTTSGGGKSVTVYDLYADNGTYFFSPTESGLAGQVSSDHNQAGRLFAREVAAAKLAATGNVKTAAQNLADAPDPSHVISPNQPVNRAAIAAKEKATGQKQAGNLFDNWVWEDSQDALIAGSGQSQVRAGVLRILATLPDVTVRPGTSGGQPTLVLTAGTPELGYGLTEQLTINSTTGVPVSSAGGATGHTLATVKYQVSRVTLSDIAAGKY